ncbi:hypothetical protein HDU87_001156 [Geranomyces variabilis]|uniref:CID domain-containing protein n=1 Tax=Geranomyces variabilis TaxID=109894 RepID=A0AAD5TCM9_9FUNG|nr:hypothetical protein HDU87_001156 [Geranomyces variabilis]
MATYDEAALSQKLAKLVDTQDSITVLAQCVHTPPETQQKIGRILGILEQRRIYPPEFVQNIKDNLSKRTAPSQQSTIQTSSLPQRSAPSPTIQLGNKITGDVAAIAKCLDEIKQLDIAKAQQSQAMSISVPDDADGTSSVIEALSQYRITLNDDIAKRTSLIEVLKNLQDRMQIFVQGDQLALDKCNERIAFLNAKQPNTDTTDSPPTVVSPTQPHTFQMPSTASIPAQVPSQSSPPSVPSPVNRSINNSTSAWPQPAMDIQHPTPPDLPDQQPPPPLAELSPLCQVLHEPVLSPAYPQPFSVPQPSTADPWPSKITDPAVLQAQTSSPDPSSSANAAPASKDLVVGVLLCKRFQQISERNPITDFLHNASRMNGAPETAEALRATIRRISLLYLQQRFDEAYDLCLRELTRDDKNSDTEQYDQRILLNVLFLRIAAFRRSEDKTQDWTRAVDQYGGEVAQVPAEVLCAGVLLLQSANLSAESRDAIEEWLATRDEDFDRRVVDPKSKLREHYERIITLYTVNVLPSLGDWEAAETFLEYHELLDEEVYKNLSAKLSAQKEHASRIVENTSVIVPLPVDAPSNSQPKPLNDPSSIALPPKTSVVQPQMKPLPSASPPALPVPVVRDAPKPALSAVSQSTRVQTFLSLARRISPAFAAVFIIFLLSRAVQRLRGTPFGNAVAGVMDKFYTTMKMGFNVQTL